MRHDAPGLRQQHGRQGVVRSSHHRGLPGRQGIAAQVGYVQRSRVGVAGSLANLDIGYPFTGLIVRRSWAEANRKPLVCFLIGEMDAVAALKADKAPATRVLPGFLEMSLDLVQ